MGAASRAVVATYVPAAGSRLPGTRFANPTFSRPVEDRASFEAICAREEDHPAILRLLSAVGQDPTSVEFQSQIDAPRYDPMDRYIVKRGGDVIAHVHLHRRKLMFGGCELLATRIQNLAVLPEYEHFDLRLAVLGAAFEEMRRDGTLLATVLTDEPDCFAELGWVPWRKYSSSSISARDLLAHLEPQHRRPASPLARDKPRRLPRIRMWRHCELDALARLYNGLDPANIFGRAGRLDCDWQWLMCRRSYDRVYVADMGDGPEFCENNLSSSDDILGYAVMKQDRIVELVTEPGNTDAARGLLTRACYDAIENGRRMIELSAPPDDALHELFVAAGGTHASREVHGRRILLAKLLDPMRFLQQIRPLLKERARSANLPVGSAVSFSCGSIRFTLTTSKRSVMVSDDLIPDYSVFLPEDLMLQLLLGYIDIREQHEANRAHVTSDEALRLARCLLPPVPAWSSPLDDLPARTW